MNVNWIWNRCARHASSLSLLAAGMLPEVERPELERHVSGCKRCQERLASLRTVTYRLEKLGRDLPASAPGPALRTRWESAIRTEAEAAAQPPSRLVDIPFVWIQGCLSGGKPAWAFAGVAWVLILMFQFAAPTPVRPASAARVPVSWQEIKLVLAKPYPSAAGASARTHPDAKDKSATNPVSPRSERAGNPQRA